MKKSGAGKVILIILVVALVVASAAILMPVALVGGVGALCCIFRETNRCIYWWCINSLSLNSICYQISCRYNRYAFFRTNR